MCVQTHGKFGQMVRAQSVFYWLRLFLQSRKLMPLQKTEIQNNSRKKIYKINALHLIYLHSKEQSLLMLMHFKEGILNLQKTLPFKDLHASHPF